MQLVNGDDLTCDQCEADATHVRIDPEDAAEHGDAIILEALCDSCYQEKSVPQHWIHKAIR